MTTLEPERCFLDSHPDTQGRSQDNTLAVRASSAKRKLPGFQPLSREHVQAGDRLDG